MVSEKELQLLALQKQPCGSWPQGRPGLLSEQTQQGIHKSGQARGNGFILCAAAGPAASLWACCRGC